MLIVSGWQKVVSLYMQKKVHLSHKSTSYEIKKKKVCVCRSIILRDATSKTFLQQITGG